MRRCENKYAIYNEEIETDPGTQGRATQKEKTHRQGPSNERKGKKAAKEWKIQEKYKKNTAVERREKPKKWGREEKKTPDIGAERKKTIKNGSVFSGKGSRKTVGNGTGRNNEIRPGPLTWTTRENIGKSRFAAKNI